MLFRSLEVMLAAVRDSGQGPPADPWLLHALAAPLGPPKKKALSPG